MFRDGAACVQLRVLVLLLRLLHTHHCVCVCVCVCFTSVCNLFVCVCVCGQYTSFECTQRNSRPGCAVSVSDVVDSACPRLLELAECARRPPITTQQRYTNRNGVQRVGGMCMATDRTCGQTQTRREKETTDQTETRTQTACLVGEVDVWRFVLTCK